MSSDVKTVLAVSDSKNLNKIKMVHPDIILSPQLFGSEILARVLMVKRLIMICSFQCC